MSNSIDRAPEPQPSRHALLDAFDELNDTVSGIAIGGLIGNSAKIAIE